MEIPFKYKDLKIEFESGFVQAGGVSLNVDVENVGFKDVDLTNPPALLIGFEEHESGISLPADCDNGPCTLSGLQNLALTGGSVNDTDGHVNLLGVLLCKTMPDSSGCLFTGNQDTGVRISDIFVDPAETIVARLNPDNEIKECSLHNEAWIYCGLPEFRFFTVDYDVWLK